MLCRVRHLELEDSVKALVTSSKRFKDVLAVDPCNDPILTLASLSCKYIAARNPAFRRVVRNIFYNLYSAYAALLRETILVASEVRGSKVDSSTIVLHTPACNVKVEVSHSGRKVIVKVDGCGVRYTCECS